MDTQIFDNEISELAINFSKTLSPLQIIFIKKLTKDYTNQRFINRVEFLRQQDSFPRNLERAFSPKSIRFHKCTYANCKIAATINLGHGWYCSWHITIQKPEDNTYQNFEEWRKIIAESMPREKEREKFLLIFTWDAIQGGD